MRAVAALETRKSRVIVRSRGHGHGQSTTMDPPRTSHGHGLAVSTVSPQSRPVPGHRLAMDKPQTVRGHEHGLSMSRPSRVRDRVVTPVRPTNVHAIAMLVPINICQRIRWLPCANRVFIVGRRLASQGRQPLLPKLLHLDSQPGSLICP